MYRPPTAITLLGFGEPEMAKPAVKYVEEEQAEAKGRDPDYEVLLRQQPQFNAEGKLMRSQNMSTVGAAWKSEKMDEETGEMVEYIGIKAHFKFEVGPEGLLLKTWRRKKK